jgi:UDP-N-acetylmuramyl pentapeptide synthase
MFKRYVRNKLEGFVKKYFVTHPNVKLICIAGSVGKTSTKAAVAELLTEKYRVRMELKNYNTPISAPMAILGIDMPENLRSMSQWRKVFKIAKQRIADTNDVDVIVQELGVDRLGDMKAFSSYLKPDITVITGVTSEHMEYLDTIENVAAEELMAANFSKMALINRNDVDGVRFSGLLVNSNLFTYGNDAPAEYNFSVSDFSINEGYKGFFNTFEHGQIPAAVRAIGVHSLRSVVAAVAVSCKMGLDVEQIQAGVDRVHPIAGRMNILRGLGESIIIDDTYNSSPAALDAAIRTLYEIDAPSRVAVIGDMNELGRDSATEHEIAGKMCDPSLLSWVVTVGPEAEKYLAPAARVRGCQVRSFKDAISAVAFVRRVTDKERGAVVLFKGSQDRIYLEEAVKEMLHSTGDVGFLVRQSPAWMEKKREFFSKVNESNE